MQIIQLIEVLIDYKYLTGPFNDQEVTKLTNDSRKVRENSCFVAIKGERFDGHSVLEEVIENGAVLLVCQSVSPQIIALAHRKQVTIVQVASTYRVQALLAHKFYGEPSSQLHLVAVTGTNGKTTTSSMISYFLEQAQRKTGLIGTLYYKVGDKILPGLNTTPDAMTLHNLYHEMLQTGCQDAIIEASSHALALGRIAYSDVDCAIFTNLTREHLDFHKTMDNYAYAKSLLFAQLGQAFHGGMPRLAIINQDDPYSEIMKAATSATILTYSLKDQSATVFADHIEQESKGLSFDLHFKGQVYKAFLPMMGQYNVMNFMAAFLCLVYDYHFEVEWILKETQVFPGVTGRMQIIEEGQDFNVVVDFAHTPDALDNVLKQVSDQVKQKGEGQVVALFGHSGGNRDSAARPELGDILFNCADRIIFTADNPRSEPVRKIVDEMIGDHQEDKYDYIEDREEAIRYAVSIMNPGDTLLLAGKGGETYQVIGDEYLPYDEIQVVRQCLRELDR